MDKHLLTEVEIKDFKCFKDFKADGFKRVNLIGGMNNVGKTAFLEACYVNLRSQDLKNFVGSLISIKFMRENLNLLFRSINSSSRITDVSTMYMEQSNNIFIKSNINLILFQIKEENGIKQYIMKFNNQYIQVNVNDFSYEKNHSGDIVFIDNFGLSNNEIISAYSAIQKEDKETFLNDTLNKFDNKITSFKIIDDKPQCKIDDSYLEITELGDGVRHLVSIVTSLYESANKYLFIDEIDNGIHYSKLDELWTIILELSKQLNVQVFATTHSKECIESYARVSKKLEDRDICYVKMSRLKDASIKAGVRDFEMLQDSIDDDHEVRGW